MPIITAPWLPIPPLRQDISPTYARVLLPHNAQRVFILGGVPVLVAAQGPLPGLQRPLQRRSGRFLLRQPLPRL